MKPLFLLSPLLLLFACRPAETKKTAQDSVLPQKDSFAFAIPTTALNAKPAPLPAPFTLETLPLEDSVKHLHAVFYFPVSGNKKLDALVAKLVRKNMEGYAPVADEQTSIEAWISSFAGTHALLSMCFTGQSFTDGAAHYNHGYTALNYDTVKQQQVFLTDIFALQTEKQKQEFCDSAVSPGSNSDLQPEPSDLKKETDFTIEKGKLIFWFDDYEKGPSMCSYEVQLRAVRKFVRSEYEWLVNSD